MESAPITNSIVKLNIGGIKYITTKQTLLGHSLSEYNFFSGLLNGDIKSMMIGDWYFIDRDGIYFQPILEYLRTTDVVIPSGMNVNSVLREAEFFGIKFPLSESASDSLYYITDEWLTKKKSQEQYNAISNLADEILVEVLSQFKQCAVDGKTIQTVIWLRNAQDSDLTIWASKLAKKAKKQHETQDIKAAIHGEIVKTYAPLESSKRAVLNQDYFLCLDNERNRDVLIEKCSSNYLGVKIEVISLGVNWKGTMERWNVGYYFVHAVANEKSLVHHLIS